MRRRKILQEQSMTNLFMKYQFKLRNALFLQQQPGTRIQWARVSLCGQMAPHHSAGTRSSAKSSADISRKALEGVNPHIPVLQGIRYHWSALPVLKECMRQDAVPGPHWLWWYTQNNPFRTWSTGKDTHVVVGASWHFCTIGTQPELIRPAGLELSFLYLVSLYHDLQSDLEYPYGLFSSLLARMSQPCLSQATWTDPFSSHDHEIPLTLLLQKQEQVLKNENQYNLKSLLRQ